ncbi:ribonuclease domain-containing protein [Nocardia sp. NPDC127526]|uniref:ribonuclease domain-containing protein n=1 Tax=Nocardia sp. NPDC127526 TaxID=3345393 RepID=UPI0036294175
MTISPRVRAWLMIGVLAALLVVGFLATRGGDQPGDTKNPRAAVTSTAPGKTTAPGGKTTAPAGQPTAVPSRAPGVPDRAYQTLVEIDAGRWPESANAPGTQGGETYFNRNRALPATDAAGKRITYQEWDVNPKRRGQDRGAERIVTGSDGSAYYTSDHYDTFTRMR